jgi:hypothetical protein
VIVDKFSVINITTSCSGTCYLLVITIFLFFTQVQRQYKNLAQWPLPWLFLCLSVFSFSSPSSCAGSAGKIERDLHLANSLVQASSYSYTFVSCLVFRRSNSEIYRKIKIKQHHIVSNQQTLHQLLEETGGSGFGFSKLVGNVFECRYPLSTLATY